MTDWKNLKRAGAYLDRSPRFVAREIKAGRLRAARIGGRGEYLTCDQWLDEYVEARGEAGRDRSAARVKEVLTAERETTSPLLDTQIEWNLRPAEDVPADPDPHVAALIDALAYRTVLQAALDQLRAITLQLDREREMRLRLVEDCRRLRSSQR